MKLLLKMSTISFTQNSLSGIDGEETGGELVLVTGEEEESEEKGKKKEQ